MQQEQSSLMNSPSQEFIQIDERKLRDMLPASIFDKVDRTRVTENFVIEKLSVQVIEVLRL